MSGAGWRSVGVAVGGLCCCVFAFLGGAVVVALWPLKAMRRLRDTVHVRCVFCVPSVTVSHRERENFLKAWHHHLKAWQHQEIQQN